MISEKALIDLQNIIAKEKHIVLSLDEIRLIGQSLIGLYSILLKVESKTLPKGTR